MNKLALYHPPIFSEFQEVAAGVTLRLGTKPSHHDANFSYRQFKASSSSTEYTHTKDEVLQVRKTLAAELLGYKGKASFVHQTHSNTIETAQTEDVEGTPEADGIVTSTPGLLIGVFVADCAGILLYDPTHRVIGTAHAGWRGTRAGIVPQLVDRMRAQGADPAAIVAYISPTACVKHYEVGEEFTEFFEPAFLSRTNGKLHFNNSAAVAAQLREKGISHIEADPRCTMESNLWHSYRRDGTLSGRTAVCIGLKA